jgi:hypothetical protein
VSAIHLGLCQNLVAFARAQRFFEHFTVDYGSSTMKYWLESDHYES